MCVLLVDVPVIAQVLEFVCARMKLCTGGERKCTHGSQAPCVMEVSLDFKHLGFFCLSTLPQDSGTLTSQ